MSDSVPCSTTVSQEIEAVGQVYPAEIPSVDDDLTIEPNLSKRGTSASPGTTLVSITPVFDQVEVDDVLPSAVEISEHKSTERSSALTSGGGSASAGSLILVGRRRKLGKRLTGWIIGPWKR